MTLSLPVSTAPDLCSEDYCVLGLATCYLKEDGEFYAVEIIEPIPSAAFEAILKGVPTSFRWAIALPLGQVIQQDQPLKPAAFPTTAQFCGDFVDRVVATVRTYQSRPQACQHLAIGDRREDLNYSLERKRVLNATHIVRTEDNVKQHPLTHQTV
ncbi:MAG: hypothetical protein VKK07_01355 [Merismopediaceae bacterium]|nr:hypothetical protein [Merismopediaceae bacterium]